jgi:hypothetical protein
MAGEFDPLSHGHPCGSFDFYDARAWQLPDLDDSGVAALQKILDHARRFHEELASSHANLPAQYRDRMLVIAGVGYKTLFRLEEATGFLGVWERMRKITDRQPGNPHRDGDGRVPLASALLDDVHTVFVRGVHSQIPNMPEVSTAVMNWFAGQPIALAETAAGALRRHLEASVAAAAPHLDGSVRASGEDPGYWREELSQPLVSELHTRVQQDELPEFHFVRLF